MRRISLLGFLLLLAPFPAWADSVISGLGAASAISDSDLFPDCQSCNGSTPALAATGTQLTTYLRTKFSASSPLSYNSSTGALTITNIPVTNLDSGSGASITAFWRGDGHWSTLPFSISGGTTGQVGIMGSSSSITSSVATGFTGSGTFIPQTTTGLLSPTVLPIGTTSALGVGSPDGITITEVGGVWTATSPATLTVTDGTHSLSPTNTVSFGPGFLNTPSGTTSAISYTVTLDTQSGNTAFAIPNTEAAKTLLRTNTVTQTDTLAAATTSGFGAGYGFDILTSGVGNTITPTTSTIGGLASLVMGANQGLSVASDGTNYRANLGLPIPATQTGAGLLSTDMTWTTNVVGTSGAALGKLNANKTDSGTNGYTGVNSFGEVHGTTTAPSLTSNNYSAVVADCGTVVFLPTGSTPTVTLPNLSAPPNNECHITFITAAAISYHFIGTGSGVIENSQAFFNTRGTNVGDAVSAILRTPSGSAAHWVVSGDLTS